MSRLPKTISVEKLDNSVLFTFAQNQHYLYDGTIEVPFNSLSIIADKSEAITLRKSASNDIFISAPWQNFDINASSKEDVVDALTDMLYDETGGGVSREEVEDMIDAATSGIPSSQVIEQLRNDVNTISGNVQTLSGEVATKADASDLQALSEKVDTKLDASAYTPTDLSEYWTSAQTKSYVDDALDDYYDKDEVDTLMGNKQDVLTAGDNITISGNVISAEAGNNIIELTQAEYDALTEKDPDALYIITDASEINMNDYWTSAETQSAIDAATSGIPSSQVIEQLRTDVNTISGDVENKQDALEYYSEAEYENGGGRGIINVSNGKTYNASVWADVGNTDGGTYARLYAKGDAGENALNVSPTGVTINDAKVLTENDIDPKEVWDTIDLKEEVVASALTSLNLRLNEDEEVTAAALNDLNENKQDALSAGTGIEISGNVISVTGASITVDTELDETSNNPVANSAITNVIIDDEEVISRAINELNDRLVAVESGGSSVTVDTSLDSGSTNPVANSAITNAINAKQDALSAGTGIEISGNVISTTGGGVTVDPTLDTGSTNPVANSAITTAINSKQNKILSTYIVDNVTYSTTSASYHKSLSIGKYYTTNGGSSSSLVNFASINGNGIVGVNTDFSLVETSAITSAITSASTNDEVAGAKAVYDALDAKADASNVYTKTEVNNLVNNKFWCGTQAQYDALATKENDVLYLIHL